MPVIEIIQILGLDRTFENNSFVCATVNNILNDKIDISRQFNNMTNECFKCETGIGGHIPGCPLAMKICFTCETGIGGHIPECPRVRKCYRCYCRIDNDPIYHNHARNCCFFGRCYECSCRIYLDDHQHYSYCSWHISVMPIPIQQEYNIGAVRTARCTPRQYNIEDIEFVRIARSTSQQSNIEEILEDNGDNGYNEEFQDREIIRIAISTHQSNIEEIQYREIVRIPRSTSLQSNIEEIQVEYSIEEIHEELTALRIANSRSRRRQERRDKLTYFMNERFYHQKHDRRNKNRQSKNFQ
jgi:hypothetical protein